MWGQGSNADVALDDIAIGAACFDTGKLLLTCHHKMLETRTKTPFNCGSKYICGNMTMKNGVTPIQIKVMFSLIQGVAFS